MSVKPGQTLSHYRLLEKIGEGGMGVVYKALDTKLDRRIAIKLLPAELTDDPERRRRFMREARSAAAVSHANIATIHEVDEIEGVTFLVMELVEGETLRSVIQRGCLAIPQALRFATEIAEGLARAHRSNVIHRDLKPENVMIGHDGHPKILDFGLAKILEDREQQPTVSNIEQAETLQTELTRRGAILGTPAYMSPEQARSETVDARSDLFSFGCMLYEMVTGKTPFRGKTHMDTLAEILNKKATPPSRLNPSVPPELDRLITRCIEKDRERRFQTTDELLAELHKTKEAVETAGVMSRVGRTLTRAWPLMVVIALVLLGVYAGPRFIDRRTEIRGRGGSVAVSIDSLAVLPMVNLSGDPTHEPLADGITDMLISDLGKIKSLQVKARPSVMTFKNTDKRLAEIASELGVAGLVTGTVFRSGDTVLLKIQLVDAASENVLWSTDIEKNVGDMLSFFADTAMNIARQVEARISPEEEDRLRATRRVDPEVQTLFLQAQSRFRTFEFEEMLQAQEEFEHVIELDPDFAPAYLELAGAYTYFSFLGFQPPRELFPKQLSNVSKALELDPDSAQAHVVRGMINAYYQWDWMGTERAYKKALEINPDHAEAHQFYAWALGFFAGRFEEAFQELEKAIDLDPLSSSMANTQGSLYYLARQYDRSIEVLEEADRKFPGNFNNVLYLGRSYLLKGRYEEALEQLERANTLSGDSVAFCLALLARGRAEAGDLEAAQEILDRLLEMSKTSYVPPCYLALVYTGLGETDLAIAELERSYENRDGWMTSLKTDPAVDPLRSDPRFQDLLQRMNFPE